MKFGVFSVSMPEYTPEESVKLLKEQGYDGVEWRVAEIPAESPAVPYAYRYWAGNKSTLELRNIMEEAKRAKALCDEAGLAIFGLTTYLAVTDKEQIVSVLKAAQAIGCPKVRVGVVAYDPDKAGEPYPALFEKMRAALKELEPYARQYGVKLVLELHANTMTASPSAGYRALEGFDPDYFGLIFDPGNMVNEGFEEYQKSFELLGPYIAHIHVKNGILEADGTDELGAAKWKRTWTPLKKGMADLKRLFAVMHKFGYDGTVSIEDFSNELETAGKLADNLAYLRALKAAAEAAE